MLKFLRSVLIGVLVIAVVIGAVAYYLLQDPNRFKPQLEALIEEQAGVPLKIAGDLDWRLWPPVSITAADLHANYEGQDWQVGRLALDLDAIAVIRNPEQWRVQSLTIENATMRQEGSVLNVNHATLTDLEPGRPAPLKATLDYAAIEGEQAIPVDIEGLIQVDPATLVLSLTETRIETPQAAGTCDLRATPVENPTPGPTPTEQDLIPVDTFRAFDWSGECLLSRLEVEGERFENVTVDLDNDAGNSAVLARIPGFFGGEAVVDVNIDARRTPVKWTVTPALTDVDSRALLAWLDQRLNWVASLAYGGTLTFEGNTAEALMASMSGETRFDGGQGRIDIARIRSQVLNLAAMFNEGERIRGWPEMWDYQQFVGNWRIDRQHHQLEAALDNLALDVEGDYDPAAATMDMLATLTFTRNPDLPVFDVNPLLYDLPIPVRCQGTLDDPTCRVDQKAAQRIVTAALGNENTELRKKLDEKIDEEVPEQYRDAARSLLDALGGRNRSEQQPESQEE